MKSILGRISETSVLKTKTQRFHVYMDPCDRLKSQTEEETSVSHLLHINRCTKYKINIRLKQNKDEIKLK